MYNREMMLNFALLLGSLGDDDFDDWLFSDCSPGDRATRVAMMIDSE